MPRDSYVSSLHPVPPRKSATKSHSPPAKKPRQLPSFMSKTYYPPPEDPVEKRLDDLEDVVQRLEARIERGTAEYRRENTDYYDGETPRTSQESNDRSDFNYSQESVEDIVPRSEVERFIFTGSADEEVLRSLSVDAAGLRKLVSTRLMSDPKALLKVLRVCLDRARQSKDAKEAGAVLGRIKRTAEEMKALAEERLSRADAEEIAVRKMFPELDLP